MSTTTAAPSAEQLARNQAGVETVMNIFATSLESFRNDTIEDIKKLDDYTFQALEKSSKSILETIKSEVLKHEEQTEGFIAGINLLRRVFTAIASQRLFITTHAENGKYTTEQLDPILRVAVGLILLSDEAITDAALTAHLDKINVDALGGGSTNVSSAKDRVLN